MRNFLAKSVTLGMLAGGFCLTGDLSWIAERGKRVFGAADIPAAREESFVAGPTPTAFEPAPVQSPRPAVSSGAEPEAPPRQATGFKPPPGGPDTIAWAALATGSRVVVWLAGPPYRCLVLDFVDPAAGEALLYDVATVSAEGRPLATAGPPQRVVLGRDQQGRPYAAGIRRGGLLHVMPVGPSGRTGGQWLGPVAAVAFGG